MLKNKKSLKKQIMKIFLLVIVVQTMLVIMIMPHYVIDVVENNSEKLTSQTISVLCSTLKMYLSDLDKITIIPYMNDEITLALNRKIDCSEQEMEKEEIYQINRSLREVVPAYFEMMNRDVTELLLLPMDNSVYLFSSSSNYYVKSAVKKIL